MGSTGNGMAVDDFMNFMEYVNDSEVNTEQDDASEHDEMDWITAAKGDPSIARQPPSPSETCLYMTRIVWKRSAASTLVVVWEHMEPAPNSSKRTASSFASYAGTCCGADFWGSSSPQSWECSAAVLFPTFSAAKAMNDFRQVCFVCHAKQHVRSDSAAKTETRFQK